MAELHVQRKRNSYTWLWVVLLLVIIAGGIYYYLHTSNPKAYPLPAKPTGFLINKSISGNQSSILS